MVIPRRTLTFGEADRGGRPDPTNGGSLYQDFSRVCVGEQFLKIGTRPSKRSLSRYRALKTAASWLKRDEVRFNQFEIPKSAGLAFSALAVMGQHGPAKPVSEWSQRSVNGVACNQAAKRFGIGIGTAIGYFLATTSVPDRQCYAGQDRLVIGTF